MTESLPSDQIPPPPRKLTLEDLISTGCVTNNKNNVNIDPNHIPKNQKDFGHKKRIKP